MSNEFSQQDRDEESIYITQSERELDDREQKPEHQEATAFSFSGHLMTVRV